MLNNIMEKEYTYVCVSAYLSVCMPMYTLIFHEKGTKAIVILIKPQVVIKRTTDTKALKRRSKNF